MKKNLKKLIINSDLPLTSGPILRFDTGTADKITEDGKKAIKIVTAGLYGEIGNKSDFQKMLELWNPIDSLGSGEPEELTQEDIDERQAYIDDTKNGYSEAAVHRILRELKVDEPVLNIYRYGSRIYGTADQNSDHDYIIVTKGAMLKSGAFKQNAISSDNRNIQGILYSRSGFTDAINNYDISALECLSLHPDDVLMNTWPFKVQKWDNKTMVKKIISKVSASWHTADMQARDGFKDRAKKGIFHALRILHFSLQLKELQRIDDFGCVNYIWEDFRIMDDDEFDTRDYIKERDELMKKLRS